MPKKEKGARLIRHVLLNEARETRRLNTKSESKDEDMKAVNDVTKMVRGSALAFASALIATFITVAPANAQYRPTGDDGITASPKLRAQLDERKAGTRPLTATGPAMACPKCKDAWVAKADTNSRGLGARTLMGQTTTPVVKHLCDGCGADWSVAGTGKAKQTVASHKCTGCGAENLACCSTKGGGNVATKGMGQKLEIAPLK